MILGAAGFVWYHQNHGYRQVGEPVTTTALSPELQGSSTAPSSSAPASSSSTSSTAEISPSQLTTVAASASVVGKSATPSPVTISRLPTASTPSPKKAAPPVPVTVTVTAKPAPACVPVTISIPFASSNHPDGVTITVMSHPLYADTSLWVPGPDSNISDWSDKVATPTPGYAAPGSGHGTVITIGHINWDGTNGAYSDLSEYINDDQGKSFTVTCSSGRVINYQISGGVVEDKGKLQQDLSVAGRPLHQQLFSQTDVYGPPGHPSERFLLMSCGGLLDEVHHNYLSNIFVYGLPVA